MTAQRTNSAGNEWSPTPKRVRARSYELHFVCALLSFSAGFSASAQDAVRINYEDHIKPILSQYCAGCHNQSRAKNGLQLDSYAGLMEGGSSGPPIVKGDPSNSLLYLVMAQEREPFMPDLEPRIADELILQVREWIAGGAAATRDDTSFVPDQTAASKTLDPASLKRPDGAPAMPQNLRADPYWWTEQPNTVNAVAASPFAPLIAVGGFHQVILYHADSGDLLGVLDFPEGDLYVLRFSRDGTLLLGAGGRGADSGRVVAWDVTSGERVLELGDERDLILAADISEDHALIALGGPSGVVRVYDTSSGDIVYEIIKHTDWITALEFSPDGVLLATGDRAGGAFVWESLTGREFHTLPSHADQITAISWRPDSQMLATAGNDARIRVINAENGRERRTWQSHGGVLAMTFDAQGRIATAGRDHIARLWNMDGAQQMQFAAMNDDVTAIAVTADGNSLIAGDWSGLVRMFTTADGQSARDLPLIIDTPFQRAIITAKNEVDRSATALATVDEKLRIATAAKDSAKTLVTEMESKAATEDANLAGIQGELTSATANHSAARAFLDSYQATLSERASEAAQLAHVVEEAQQQAGAQQSRLKQLIAREAATLAELNRRRITLEQAKQALESAPDDAQIKQQVAQAQQAVQKSEIELSLARELLAGALARAREAAERIARAQVDAAAAATASEAWTTTNADTVNQHNAAVKDAAAVFTRHEELQIKADAALSELTAAREQLSRAEEAARMILEKQDQSANTLAQARAARAAAEITWNDQRAAIETARGRVVE